MPCCGRSPECTVGQRNHSQEGEVRENGWDNHAEVMGEKSTIFYGIIKFKGTVHERRQLSEVEFYLMHTYQNNSPHNSTVSQFQ